MLRLFLGALSLTCLISLQWACSSPKVNAGGSGVRAKPTEEGKVKDEDGLGFEDCDGDEKAPAKDALDTTGTDVNTGDPDGDPLFLLGNDTYEGDDGVEDLLQQHCVACHQEGGVDGAIALDTFASAKDNAAAILERMELEEDDPELMPPGNKLGDSDIDRVKAWIDGGKQKGGSSAAEDKDSDSKENGDTDEDETATNPCGSNTKPGTKTSNDSGDDDVEDEEELVKGAFDQFIKPPARENCMATGKVYDRELQDCTLDLASIECNWTAVKTAFGNSEGIVKAQADLEADGFILDQCGQTSTGKLHVYLYCLAKESGGLCVDESQLETAVFVQTRKIKQPE